MTDRRRRNLLAPLLPLILLSSLATECALAQSIGSNTLTRGTAVDGGANHGWTMDGVFDEIQQGSTLYLQRSQGVDGLSQIERRSVWEYKLPDLLLRPGVSVTSATLNLGQGPWWESPIGGSDLALYVYGYNADGQLTLSDFTNTGNLVWSVNNTVPPLSANVTTFVQSLVGNGTHAGFVVALGGWESQFAINPDSTLQISYSTSGTNPPDVTILSPAPNSLLPANSPITFSGSAWDLDGHYAGALSWSSNVSGPLGTGSSLTVSSLPPGPHVITASATDITGLTGQQSINITVNSPPTYCAARGNSSTYEWITYLSFWITSKSSGNNGGYADFSNEAPHPLRIGSNSVSFIPGFKSGNSHTEHWRAWVDLNRDGTFGSDELRFSGSGASVVSGSLTIPAGSAPGTTRMRVAMKYGSGAQPCENFSYGEVEDYTVNITP